MSASRTNADAPAKARSPSRWRVAVPAVLAVAVTAGLVGGIAAVVTGLLSPAPPSTPPPGAADDGGAVETAPPDDREGGAASPTEGSLRPPVNDPVSEAWVDRVAGATGIPHRALRGYAMAQLRLSEEEPDCQVSWPTLAAIGEVESHHGTLTGGTIEPGGRTSVDIIGVPLDGSDGTVAITDTDGGELDGDPEWDRAVGPMQFIPRTWERWGVSASGSGTPDPHHVDDAALSAARYLCSGGRDLTDADDWWEAVLAYNESERYAGDVLDVANQYVASAG